MVKQVRFLVLFAILFSCNSYRQSTSSIDRSYDLLILNTFKDVLNDLAPDYQNPLIREKGFVIINNKLQGVCIIDLVDTSNNNRKGDVSFIQNHIYHFVPVDIAFSYSNIAIIRGNNIKIFKALNCSKYGNEITEVIAYVRDSISIYQNNQRLLERISNYRKYGYYIKIDEQSEFICK